jgi:hypothetical protein
MQERVIENWLTSANELSFTIPFSQVLALQGHKVVHISPKKATLEQGKDIISIDPAGVIHCYQLKGDDVTLKRWRDEVKPEIEAMVDLPPQHPSLGRVENWQCHLVVNGEFRGEATREIVDTQNARIAEGRRSFTTVVRGELLAAFTSEYGKYLPREPGDFASFIDLYREPGLEPLDRPAYSRFLEQFFGFSNSAKKLPANNEVRQQINAAIVSASYLLSEKYRSQNHVAIIEGWVSLLAHILAVADRYELDKSYWRASVDLVEQVICETIGDLLDEIEARDHYAQPAPIIYSDAYVYKLRVTIVAGYLAAYSLYSREEDSENPHTRSIRERTVAFLDRALSKGLFVLLGEAQVAPLACIALLYATVGDNDKAIDLIRGCTDSILEGCRKGGVYDPYTDAQEIIRTELEITGSPVEHRAGLSAFTLEALVLISTYLGDRQYLEARWRQISHVSIQTFIPAKAWQWYLWDRPDGKQESRFPSQTESWLKLREYAVDSSVAQIPALLREDPARIPLFWCLMPHRISGYSTRAFQSFLASRASQ